MADSSPCLLAQGPVGPTGQFCMMAGEEGSGRDGSGLGRERRGACIGYLLGPGPVHGEVGSRVL